MIVFFLSETKAKSILSGLITSKKQGNYSNHFYRRTNMSYRTAGLLKYILLRKPCSLEACLLFCYCLQIKGKKV